MKLVTSSLRLLVAAALTAAAAAATTAQEPPPENPSAPVNKELIEAALKLTQSAAVKYEITLAEEGKPVATLRKDPVLKWSNPSVGEIHGNVFLWTVDNRPAAVGSLFKWFTPHTHMSHEFHSLSEVPLAANYEEREVWRPQKGGVTFAPVPRAARPADTATRRLLQMREIAKGFSATKTERDGNQQELRLLPQPVYRYAAANQKIIDGALFVLVQGTDPEVFVLLEARGEPESAQWMLAAARMNSVGFDLRYHDATIWTAEIMPWKDVGSHAEPYTTFMFKMP
jgi:hypothetical protein